MGGSSSMERSESGKDSSKGEQIENSKRHWTHVPNVNSAEEELAKRSNMEVFETLQSHPKWGNFFYKFGEGELVVNWGEKFAEGGQAELYEAQVIKWRHRNWRELEIQREGMIDPCKYLLKVFKKGTFLRDMEKQWPEGMFQFYAEKMAAWRTRRHNCDVVCGTLLEDGRFAFVLQREQEDLRKLIDRHKTSSTGQQKGPFAKEVVETLMYEIALGMDWLHSRDIVHRDLKASNVLVREDNDWYYCFVADYECSVGVEGTTFWRAPEILQAFKRAKSVRDFAGKQTCKIEREKLFTKEADVYSYGMTCYEILTGRLPFEDHESYEFDVVLEGQLLELPEYVDYWMQELLTSCWQCKPEARPSFRKILKLLSENSATIQGHMSMDADMAHSNAHWSQDKTVAFKTSVLIQMYKAKRAAQYVTAEISKTTEFLTALFNNDDEETTEREGWSAVEEQIESSMSHWSELAEHSGFDEEESAEVDNVEVFKMLEMHPTWGRFFWNWDDFAELVIGEKFAEGGQAELYHAQVNWGDAKENEEDRRERREWVMKLYKKGTFLRHLQLQWPRGMFRLFTERIESAKGGATPGWNEARCVADMKCGTLLRNGRFAFLSEKKHEDLRSVIDHNMLSGESAAPFSEAVTESIMYKVAQGMDTLHSYDIVHRDLKASNVLVNVDKDGNYQCFVADYECAIGVIGTGFFRAPEVLQACKDRNVSQRPEVFSKAGDVYTYGMTCYEILTGKLPFEGHPWRDYDLVLHGGRPDLPNHVDDWARGLLSSWRSNPVDRPSFGQILESFETLKGNLPECPKYLGSNTSLPTNATIGRIATPTTTDASQLHTDMINDGRTSCNSTEGLDGAADLEIVKVDE